MAFRPPYIPPQTLVRFIIQNFPFSSVEVESIKQFDGYDDRNYYFEGELKPNVNNFDSKKAHHTRNEFVIKFLNSRDSKNVKVVEGLTELTKYLGDKLFKCPYPIPSLYDSEIVVKKHSELLACVSGEKVNEPDLQQSRVAVLNGGSVADRHYCVRIFAFVPGGMFGYEEQSPELLHDLGYYVGRLNSVMKDFSHPGLEGRDTIDWDLRFIMSKKGVLSDCIVDPERRNILSSVLDDFEKYVLSVMHDTDIEWGIIHNDVNPMNIVTSRNSSGRLFINGLIDFTESVPSPYVFELGVTMAYVMIRAKDPIKYVKPVIQGYLSNFPLSKASLDLVYYVILGRLALSYINAMFSYKAEPTNEYILADAVPGWDLMDHLLKAGKERCYREWGLLEEDQQ